MEGGSALHCHTPITHLLVHMPDKTTCINDMCIKMLQFLEKCDTMVTIVLHQFYLQVAL
jgi:hypothetical protein